MSDYPVLDQDSYQAMSSEWVMYAGELLRQRGYLTTEPTGVYDDELSTAVVAFQSDNGIAEANQIGPETWAALGGPEATATDGTDYGTTTEGYEDGGYTSDPGYGSGDDSSSG